MGSDNSLGATTALALSTSIQLAGVLAVGVISVRYYALQTRQTRFGRQAGGTHLFGGWLFWAVIVGSGCLATFAVAMVVASAIPQREPRWIMPAAIADDAVFVLLLFLWIIYVFRTFEDQRAITPWEVALQIVELLNVKSVGDACSLLSKTVKQQQKCASEAATDIEVQGLIKGLLVILSKTWKKAKQIRDESAPQEWARLVILLSATYSAQLLPMVEQRVGIAARIKTSGWAEITLSEVTRAHTQFVEDLRAMKPPQDLMDTVDLKYKWFGDHVQAMLST
jgi:hypothetical protein